MYKITPTLILPPQGGGNLRRVNTSLKGEEIKKSKSFIQGRRKKVLILPLKGEKIR